MFNRNKAEPRPEPVRPLLNAWRVVRPFTCEGRLFRAGTLVSSESEFAQAIYAQHPEYFESANR